MKGMANFQDMPIILYKNYFCKNLDVAVTPISTPVKGKVEGRGSFPLKIIIGYLLSSFSVGSIGKRGSLTIVLLLRRAVERFEKFWGGYCAGHNLPSPSLYKVN